MSLSEPRAFLIAYDIADPGRLSRVHRYLKSVATDVQYSVFAAVVSPVELDRVLAELAERIDARQDDVRAYPVPRRSHAVALGRQHLPDGVFLTDEQLLRLVAAALERNSEAGP
jgi:CRISPR-associated protein Cas2